MTDTLLFMKPRQVSLVAFGEFMSRAFFCFLFGNGGGEDMCIANGVLCGFDFIFYMFKNFHLNPSIHPQN